MNRTHVDLAGPPRSPFRSEPLVPDVPGEVSFLEPEVDDRELELFETLHESLTEAETEAFEEEYQDVHEDEGEPELEEPEIDLATEDLIASEDLEEEAPTEEVEVEALAPNDDLPAVPVRSDLPVENDLFHVDPRYASEGDEVPPVWLLADRMRTLLRQKTHSKAERGELKNAVERQLRTATPFDLVRRIVQHAKGPGRLTMFVLLFPGEARDNTGLKDLNDHVLGYILQQQFTARRRREIEAIFHPEFVVAGQDFKIAIFLSWQQNRAEFDRRLHLLDKKLREILLQEFLPKSKKPGAADLRRVLEKDPEYRFDIYYGTDVLTVEPQGQQVLTAVYLLLTQALKAAAVGRYISKGQSLKTRVARRFGENAKRDKKVDPRGKAFSQQEFAKVAAAAPAIKAFMLKAPIDHTPVSDFNTIYVDTVWTQAFYARQSVGNRDVIRDVRKKKLERPKWPNVKNTFTSQRELLELWLVTLNLVDFIKDFLDAEFATDLLAQHQLAVQVLDDLRDEQTPIDRQRTEGFLSRDVRSRDVATLGATSEYQFYARAADHPARIMFVMDVRDLGVEVLMMYDRANAKILDERLSGEKLLHETLSCTESVTQMRRFTLDLVVSTFGRYHALLRKSASVQRTNGSAEATKAFRSTPSALGTFEDDVQILLGGDEIIVAAHPRFAAYTPHIVKDLSETVLGPGPAAVGAVAPPRLGIRAGVCFSSASPPDQRKARQLSHQQALRLADESHTILKELERQHRRVERLLERLDLVKDKRHKIEEYRRQLEALRLRKLFTRIKHGDPRLLSHQKAEALIQGWRQAASQHTCPPGLELVDHDGQIIDCPRLIADADRLEAAVRKDVGNKNVHVDPPPAVKIPLPKPGKDKDKESPEWGEQEFQDLVRPLLTPFGVEI